jgi:drug/metabolite transporter (DMT)-like permease
MTITAVDPTLAVLYSELVLSLYPLLIKTVNTNLFTQILARFLVFPTLAIMFGSTRDFTLIWHDSYEAFVAILHNLLNLGHILTSYISFKELSVGTAISLFYLYPIFNIIAGVLLFGESFTLFSITLIAVAFIGTYLIATSKKISADDANKRDTRRFGIMMGILAAITESMIFIFIRSNKDARVSPYYTVNHLYPSGLILLLVYAFYNSKVVDTNAINWMELLAFNVFLGFTGYIARYYAISKISTITFSLLSFLGVGFGYIWEILFTGDKPTIQALVGGGLIAGATAILRYSE